MLRVASILHMGAISSVDTSLTTYIISIIADVGRAFPEFGQSLLRSRGKVSRSGISAGRNISLMDLSYHILIGALYITFAKFPYSVPLDQTKHLNGTIKSDKEIYARPR